MAGWPRRVGWHARRMRSPLMTSDLGGTSLEVLRKGVGAACSPV